MANYIWIIAAAIAVVIIGCPLLQASPISFSDLLRRERPVATQHIAYGKQPAQFGELWLPEGPGPHPVLVMIHGGCWQAALPGVELMAYIAEDMSRSGFAVWNLEYRRLGTPGAGYPGTFLDIADGMDYLRILKETYALDLSHVVVTGHSAGGQLALWAAGRNRLKQSSALYRENPLPVQGVVTLAGINDLAAYSADGPSACGGPRTIAQLVGREQRVEHDVYADTSPAAMLPLQVKQAIISGDLDPIVPARFGTAYAAKAKAAGDNVEVLTLKDAGHFELIDPASAAWAEIKKILLAYK
jgi:acetyl esterase/lipase